MKSQRVQGPEMTRLGAPGRIDGMGFKREDFGEIRIFPSSSKKFKKGLC
jgi:hypothetical protein